MSHLITSLISATTTTTTTNFTALKNSLPLLSIQKNLTRRSSRRRPVILSSSSSPSYPSDASASILPNDITSNSYPNKKNSSFVEPTTTNNKFPSSANNNSSFNHALPTKPTGPLLRFLQSTEGLIEKTIFDFRFLALFAIAGSLAGSLLCFLNGCVYIYEAYKVYWTSCVKGIHSGQMVLRLVEAIDVYLAGTVMLIFGMGLYGLFISNSPHDAPPSTDRALKGSSLFGMFALTERPTWMKISSLDELKTKVGHVIVMILLVKMFERSKTVIITTGVDLLSYSVCIFFSSASLYILHNLHKD
ncbi:hypothetical protein MKW94_030419 [Papaver nudicaule]|uniref:Structural constituent of ribosome n=1 Tax=Papaver nudicaule TaxID=74823 RepID=A0AA41UVH2_PAPNU|nr:hypothetical protein [Papaver nudicaule]